MVLDGGRDLALSFLYVCVDLSADAEVRKVDGGSVEKQLRGFLSLTALLWRTVARSAALKRRAIPWCARPSPPAPPCRRRRDSDVLSGRRAGGELVRQMKIDFPDVDELSVVARIEQGYRGFRRARD